MQSQIHEKQKSVTLKMFKWVGIPMALILANCILYFLDLNNVWWNNLDDGYMLALSIAILTGTVMYGTIFLIINFLSRWVDRKSIFKNNLFSNFFVTTVVVVIAMFLLIYLEEFLYSYFCTEDYPESREMEQSYRNYLIVNMIVAAFLNSFYNSFVIFERWKAEAFAAKVLLIESYELKEYALQAELEVLKLQLDPHFLFNNFSILTQLIQTNKEGALLFLENLSKVYRYILASSKKDITSIEEELKFVLNYFHLIKIRHGDAIHLEIHIAEEVKKNGIPPVTLQLLIENAIKHNISTLKSPLYISISSDEKDYLTIKNNIQKINIPYKGTGLGLSNISERYYFLSNHKPIISEDNNEFVVKLPILNY